MFPRMNITAPLTPFAYCPPQYGAGVGIGAINPTVSYMASPYMSSPLPVPYPVIGPSPYALQSAIPCPPGVIPCPPGQIGAGVAPWCSPLSLSPYAFAQATPIHPAMHPALAGMTPAVYGAPVPCPVTCIDPVTGAVVPRPYPGANSLLQMRPLITDTPVQVWLYTTCGVIVRTLE